MPNPQAAAAIHASRHAPGGPDALTGYEIAGAVTAEATTRAAAVTAEATARAAADSTLTTNIATNTANIATNTASITAKTLADVAAVVTVSGALTAGRHNPVDATAGNLTMTLANASLAGQHTVVEKTDASVNTVTITGNIRGTPGSSVVLVWQREAIELLSKADGSWWPIAGHKTKASLDAAYGGAAALVAPLAGGATGQVLSKTSGVDYAFAWVAAGAGGGSAAFQDFQALGNLGATETVIGVVNTLVRAKGTLDANCTITISMTDNQMIQLWTVQDSTGLRVTTFTGVDVWLTSTGVAPNTASRLAGTLDIYEFVKIAGVTYGLWRSEPEAPNRFARTAGQWCGIAAAGTVAGAVMVANRTTYAYLDVPSPSTITAVGLGVFTAVASSTARLGIWADNGSGKPGVLIQDLGTVSGAASNSAPSIATSVSVLPGRVWFSATGQGTMPNIYTHYGYADRSTVCDATATSLLGQTVYIDTHVGALPSPATPTPLNVVVPSILVKF